MLLGVVSLPGNLSPLSAGGWKMIRRPFEAFCVPILNEEKTTCFSFLLWRPDRAEEKEEAAADGRCTARAQSFG